MVDNVLIHCIMVLLAAPVNNVNLPQACYRFRFQKFNVPSLEQHYEQSMVLHNTVICRST